MAVRMTGLISGMDTETLIKNMMDAQRMKNKKTTDKQTTLTWKQEKWKELNTKLYKLYTDDLSKMRLQSSYMTKKVTASNESLVSVTGSTTAPEGSHTISNIKLASGQYVTGTIIQKTELDGKAISGTSKLTEVFEIADKTLITVEGNGTKTTLDVNSDTTINSFIQTCKDAGLNASYDTVQKRFFISSKNSGADNKFTITTSTETGTVDKRAIDSAIGYSGLSSTDKAKADAAYLVIKGADSVKLADALTSTVIDEGDDDETKALKNAVSTLNDLAKTKVTNEVTNEAKSIATDRAKEALTNAIVNGTSYAGVDYAGVYDAHISTAEDELKKKYADNNLDFTNEVYKKERDALVSSHVSARVSSSMSANEVKAIIAEEQQKIIDEGTTVITNNEDGSTTTKVIVALSTAESATLSAIKLNMDGYSKSTSSNTTGELSKLGLSEIIETIETTVGEDGEEVQKKVIKATNSNVTLVDAVNSSMNYNGVNLTGTSNVITANGLTFTLKGETTETISLSVVNDTQTTYDMVKKFITSYNDILKEMNNLYYAESARSYAPLSDDDKEAMTDDQIEKWESKIKDASLRRDSSLGTLLDSMKSAMNTQISVNDKKYSLASYGIQTSSDYSEKGLLHIYGNADDSIYSGNADKLMKALEEDPDTVMEVLSGITKNLYNTMADKMKAIPNVSSALTFYNDKLMANQQTEYTKRIAILENKLVDMEDKYYKQFAAMETAMAKLQSQSNALASMLGTSTQ